MSRHTNARHKDSNPDQLMWRVVDYLRSNPGEYLTRHDVAVKFNVSDTIVDAQLAPAVAAGFLHREDVGGDGVVWRIPPKGRRFPKPHTPALVAATRAMRAEKAAARRFEFGSITIEHGIPLAPVPLQASPWASVFDQMRPGDSFQLATTMRTAFGHAQLKYRKKVPRALFATRKISETHLRVWRTA